MEKENIGHITGEARGYLSAQDDSELAERILKNVFFAKNAFYFLGSTFERTDNKNKEASEFLLEKTHQKMIEVNDCLKEILERMNILHKGI